MIKQSKKIIMAGIVISVIIVVSGLWLLWHYTAATTRVALVNFQAFQVADIVRANDSRFVKYVVLPTDKISKAKRYDCVLAFGMGLNITAEQRACLQRLADKGTPVYVYAATNPDNDICSLDSTRRQIVQGYLGNGNRHNYRNLARYIRRDINHKRFFIPAPAPVTETASDVLYHLDADKSFKTVSEYENYLKEKHFYIKNAPKIAILGGFNDPFGGNRDNIDSLIMALWQAGNNVYPVSSLMKRLDFLKEIQPDAVIYFAHGRLSMGQGDTVITWLKMQNIPLFAPLSLLQTREEWEADLQGMSGGFLSQSIVMPELDGAIYPYVLTSQEIDPNGLYLFKSIPERLHNFTQIIHNFIKLKKKNNADKKVAIYYFKGAGQATLTAQGLETVPSLYNLLKRLQSEGYKVENLPSTLAGFEHLLMTQGEVLSTYAEGAFDHFLRVGNPALVTKSDYETWAAHDFPTAMYEDIVKTHGDFPGDFMSVHKDGQACIAVARLTLGNIVLLPQPMAALGNDAFAIIHGAKTAPPYPYIVSYLWARHAFEADALLHFGTHGSLEFTPQKQVALSRFDWADRLVGTLPHFYYYTIGNIGESMMAKRRSYATTISYLTPAFMESQTRAQFKLLQDKIQSYYKLEDKNPLRLSISLEIKKIAVKMGLHRDLKLDSLLQKGYTAEEIERLDHFAEEIANEKMTGHLYTLGIPYSTEKIRSTVLAMTVDPIAYSLAHIDKSTNIKKYIEQAKILVHQILNGKNVNDNLIRELARISPKELSEAHTILMSSRPAMPAFAIDNDKTTGNKKNSVSGGHPAWIPKIGKRPTRAQNEQSDINKSKPDNFKETNLTVYSKEQKERARAIVELERALKNILIYKKALEESPEKEIQSLLNALSGGYVAPSSGGDAVANPRALPTGHNLYAINAEATPSETAWEKGVSLVKATLEQYYKQHGDYPRKVSYTFWSSEFIESEGTTIAQVLYMLGVEPVRDAFGRVSDLQLIASADLGRPRVDVVVQTSGQFRDLAASRLALINRAVEMAATATDREYENRVAKSTIETERLLVEQGIVPKEARELSTQRVFGGINGMYGTNIQGMVTAGDRWETEKEIADTYIHNMGAMYGNDKAWGAFHEGLLRAVLHDADMVIQPRQSNTWGALSLDHVYEFMGGLNLAIRDITGKDPEAYFADYRNRYRTRVQELKEAIGVEARTTIFNPAYIKEVMQGEAASAAQITEVVTNTYAWNVMKPKIIDQEMWNKIYSVYVQDEYKLGVEAFFRRVNPQALQEITAVMLETARKGLWIANEEQLTTLARLHADMVREYGSAATGFAGNNKKLQAFIAQKVDPSVADNYKHEIEKMQHVTTNEKNGVVLKKETISTPDTEKVENKIEGWTVAIVILAFCAGILAVLRKRKRQK
ncbi:MAG: cobaltochelatase subunit CobN [Bacteroidales bacterium]|jgi:cobaltochelatase CobN|nr:cobaltochelatase subunit CobN [Bacteroidales bacterium]